MSGFYMISLGVTDSSFSGSYSNLCELGEERAVKKKAMIAKIVSKYCK